MRLVTRSDFDGLACGALLKDVGVIDNWKFAHPKDLQDGLVEITKDDCLANVPFVEGCGLWFDHHSSEFERNQLEGKYKGESRIAPSCARIIYDYYGGEARFAHYDDMMIAVDKVDSGNLTREEILNPTGWILIGFLMDPRTGLGRWRNFTISNYQLMEKLIDCCRTMNVSRSTMSRQKSSRKWSRLTQGSKRTLSSPISVVLTRYIQETDSLFTASILSRIFPHG